MLDPRLTRIFVLPILAVVVIVAFSVQDRPRPLRTFQPTDSFSGAAAMVDVNRLAAFYPVRSTGSVADNDAAAEIEARFSAAGLAVDREMARVRTADGRGAEAIQVYGRRPGAQRGTIVIAGARDTVHSGSRAEATATATLLQLAEAVSNRRMEHTVVFVSLSGVPGQGAARALAKELGGVEDVRAVIMLGTLGTSDLAAPVVVASSGPEFASLRLRRTLEDALRAQRSVGDARPSTGAQLVRLAAPLTVGGQGPLLRAGWPAILLSSSGDRVPPIDVFPRDTRLEADGRATLRAIVAIDNAGPIDLGPEQRLSTAEAVIPGWAIRAIVFALLFPPALLVFDGIARARRDRQRTGRWVLWTVLYGLPQLLGLAVVGAAVRLGWIELPGGPIDPAIWTGTLTPLTVFVVVTLLGHLLLRPLLLAAAGLRQRRVTAPAAPLGLSAVLVVTAAATWIANPAAAAMMVPAVIIWPLILDVRMRPGRVWAMLGVLVGLAPLLALLVHLVTRYPIGDAASTASWFVSLLGAGDLGLFPQLWFSMLGGCGLAALVLAAAGRSDDPGDAEVTVRGPVSYAGPGSLGGVDSALMGRR